MTQTAAGPTTRRRPYSVQIGMDAIVVRADGSSVNFGDAIYHPENVEEARAYAEQEAVAAFARDLLAELSESPLPGARYAYEVVKRRLLDAGVPQEASRVSAELHSGGGPATPGPTGATANETPPAGSPAPAARLTWRNQADEFARLYREAVAERDAAIRRVAFVEDVGEAIVAELMGVEGSLDRARERLRKAQDTLAGGLNRAAAERLRSQVDAGVPQEPKDG